MFEPGDRVYQVENPGLIGTILDLCPVTRQCWIEWDSHKSAVYSHALRHVQQTIVDSSGLL